MPIPPTEERTIRIQDLKINPLYEGSPLIFNVHMDTEKSAFVFGLTHKEAYDLENKLRLALNKMFSRRRKKR